MKNIFKKEMGKKTISLFEIFVLVVSIVAIGYFLGDEFRIVSAFSGADDASCNKLCINSAKLLSGKCRTNCSGGEVDIKTLGDVTGVCDKCCCKQEATGTKIQCTVTSTLKIDANTYGCDVKGQNNYNCKCDDGAQTCKRTCSSKGVLGACLCTTYASEKKTNPNLVEGVLPLLTTNFDKFKGTCTGTCVDSAVLCPKGTAPTSSPLRCEKSSQICCTPSGTGTQNEDTSKDETSKTEEEIANDKLASNIGLYAGAIIFNAVIAVGLYGATQLLKGVDIMPPEVVDQLSWALSLGYGAGALLATLAGTTTAEGVLAYYGGSTMIPVANVAVPTLGLVGLGIGLIIWALFAKDQKIIAIYYTCNQWQPPKGGSDCDKCNSDSFLCTSYKCQSLGKSCRLLNQGTAEEKCTWVDKNDIEPPAIMSWDKPLKENFYYEPANARLTPTQTTSSGVSIKYNGANADAENCIPPYTILKFGIGLTDGTGKPKLGHCKYDIVRTDKFETMKYSVDNLWDMYNHTLTMIHGDVNKSVDGINVPNGGNFEVYVRCESTNGYSNVGTFVFKYCVSSAPDNEAPQIILTTPLNGMPVSFGATSQDVLVYVDKPAECKWSHANEDYDTMTETMNCDQTMGSNLLYRCNATLNGIEDDKDNNFYFNCKSHPEYEGAENQVYRRSMAQSYAYKLKGTRQLVIDWVKPETGSVTKAATSKVNVKLEAHTSSGYQDGKSWCFFKSSIDTYDLNCNLNGPGLFSNTNSFEHSQDLWLSEGTYTYQIKCCDLGGNSDTKETTFTVDTDRDFPIVVRMYNENKKLKIVTNEQAKCFYSISDCSYKIDEGIRFGTINGVEHTIEWNTNNNLYIKCKDNFDSQPAPNECTIEARPFSSL